MARIRRLAVVALAALVAVGMMAIPSTAFTEGQYTWTTGIVHFDDPNPDAPFGPCEALTRIQNRSDETVNVSAHHRTFFGEERNLFINDPEEFGPGHSDTRVTGALPCEAGAIEVVADSDALTVNVKVSQRILTYDADGNEVTRFARTWVPVHQIGPNGVGLHGETLAQAEQLSTQVGEVGDDLGSQIGDVGNEVATLGDGISALSDGQDALGASLDAGLAGLSTELAAMSEDLAGLDAGHDALAAQLAAQDVVLAEGLAAVEAIQAIAIDPDDAAAAGAPSASGLTVPVSSSTDTGTGLATTGGATTIALLLGAALALTGGIVVRLGRNRRGTTL
jgi:hypothetical protein